MLSESKTISSGFLEAHKVEPCRGGVCVALQADRFLQLIADFCKQFAGRTASAYISVGNNLAGSYAQIHPIQVGASRQPSGLSFHGVKGDAVDAAH